MAFTDEGSPAMTTTYAVEHDVRRAEARMGHAASDVNRAILMATELLTEMEVTNTVGYRHRLEGIVRDLRTAEGNLRKGGAPY